MEAEDFMWKQIYTKLQAQKSNEYIQTDHELRYVSIYRIITKHLILNNFSYVNT